MNVQWADVSEIEKIVPYLTRTGSFMKNHRMLDYLGRF